MNEHRVRRALVTVAAVAVCIAGAAGVSVWNASRSSAASTPVSPDLGAMLADVRLEAAAPLTVSAPGTASGAAAPPPTAVAPAVGGAATAGIQVHVAGAVKSDGVYSLPAGARVRDALAAAGGPSAEADLEAINLADRLRDEDFVYVPPRGRRAATRVATQVAGSRSVLETGGRTQGRYPAPVEVPLPAAAASSPASSTPTTGASAGETQGLVNINTADAKELESLPRVGPKIAERIIEHRRQHGPFLRIEDIQEVKGIGAKTFEQMKDRLTVR